MNKERLVTVRLSAKDLKEHREECKSLLVKHSGNIIFIGVSIQTFKLFAKSVANETNTSVQYKVIAPKWAKEVTKEYLEEKCGYDVTEYVIGEVGKAKAFKKEKVLYPDDETVQEWYDMEWKTAADAIKTCEICFYENRKSLQKDIEDQLKLWGVHYNKVYSRNGRWFVQWRSNKHRWTIRY